MRKIRVLLADDEAPARADLRYILEDMPEVEVAGECASGDEVLKFLQKDSSVDLLFLDVEMPGKNGLETAAAINQTDLPVRIVFSTGFSRFAVQAFELEAFDYIMKPYSDERVENTIRRFTGETRQKEARREAGGIIFTKKKLAVYANDKILLLDPENEIMLVKTEKGSDTLFYTTRGILASKISLKEAERILLASGFCRTHKSYLVNLNKIKEMIPWFNDTFLLVTEQYEKEQVPVSRHYLKSFKEMMHLI